VNQEQVELEIKEEAALIERLYGAVGRRIVGQKMLLDRLLEALIVKGHVLIEGLPGLAKTSAVKALAEACDLTMSRIQFTPDLLPADVVGTQVYDPKASGFYVKKGPVFANLVLADEINRAPAKVQSALLEAMQERQVTIGENSFSLDDPFLVLATQNPIEQEGTYSLPEAQLDRFIYKVKVSYGTPSDEMEIMRRITSRDSVMHEKVITAADLQRLQKLAYGVHVSDKIRDYIVRIVFATRQPKDYGMASLASLIRYGASPRASINFELASRAHALLAGRAFVIPQDIKDIAHDLLRHRVLLSFEAEAEGISPDEFITKLLAGIAVP
jgi:MoxR-like ATPase